MRIGVDLMGSERAPCSLFQAVMTIAKQRPNDDVMVCLAMPRVIEDLQHVLREHNLSQDHARIEFFSVEEEVAMEDLPLTALRQKRRSSIAEGLRLLKDGSLHAFVSTGNTGALIAQAGLTLRRFPSIDRPALLAVLPTEAHPVAVLDVGAHVVCTSEDLLRHALMGAAYYRCCYGNPVPGVGLLNIGMEESKGSLELRKAYKLLEEMGSLSAAPFVFQGNVEGNEVFQGKVDVLVTDGFTGNVFLKTSEGVSAFILQQLQNKFAPCLSEDDRQNLNAAARSLHAAAYPHSGALLMGVEGIVVKCHGSAHAETLANGILCACRGIEHKLIERTAASLSSQGSLFPLVTA